MSALLYDSCGLGLLAVVPLNLVHRVLEDPAAYAFLNLDDRSKNAYHPRDRHHAVLRTDCLEPYATASEATFCTSF